MTKLKRYLRDNNLRLLDFAPLVGADIWRVSRWANGHEIPTARYLAAIEQATGGQVKTADWLPENTPGRAAE